MLLKLHTTRLRTVYKDSFFGNRYRQETILLVTGLDNTGIRQKTSFTLAQSLKLGPKCAFYLASCRTSALSEHADRSFRKIPNGSSALKITFVFGMSLSNIPNRHIFDSMMAVTLVPVTAVSITFALSIDSNLFESIQSNTR